MISLQRSSALLISLFLMGCGQVQMNDLEQYVQETQQLPAAPIPGLPELPELEQVDYIGEQVRSPFISTNVRAQTTETGQANCPQPDLARTLMPLESFALDQLTFSGTIRATNGEYSGLMISNEGRLYRVSRGDFVGMDRGEVTAVTPDFIMLKEWIATGDGCWQRRDTQINLLNSQGSSNQ